MHIEIFDTGGKIVNYDWKARGRQRWCGRKRCLNIFFPLECLLRILEFVSAPSPESVSTQYYYYTSTYY